MKKPIERDRRRHKRLELTNLVAYKNFCIEEVSETINISLGGMKIKTEFPIDEGESLEVSLKIGDNDFESKARVIYCNGRGDETYEVGVRFEETPGGHVRILSQYLANQD
ncbi:MAG: hypothetical protein GTN74_02210 [Proteobacteria bacterium]|nr:hypothetical protein [Pseudomonadota bacterium]NIS67966.1 hypothetical protein [Pseudomonadota bacterium]